MRSQHTFIVVVLIGVIYLAPTTIHSQSNSSRPLTNQDIIVLVGEGFSSDIISAKIASTACDFDTSVDGLKGLKKANVPHEVILAMVKARPPTELNSSSKLKYIKCPNGGTEAILWAAPGEMKEVSRLRCNEQVTVLAEMPPWVLARTETGLTGYLSISYFNRQNFVSESSKSDSSRAAEPPPKPKAATPAKPYQPRLAEPRASTCGSAVESSIEGEFHGWDGETIFKLTNGQIWQQVEYDYTYEYDYNPDVTIYQTSMGCKMKVDGVEETILVRRIK